jgi:Domain of unknown function (DUF6048)
MLRLRLIEILLLSLSSTLAFSQAKDSVRRDTITIKDYIPTGIRIGTDLISLVKSQYQKDFSGWEVNADVDFRRYYLAIDYGSWSRTFESDSGNYSNDGTYWRVGVDVNFLMKDIDRNLLFFGARYGRSTFSEDLSIYAYNDFTETYETLNYAHSGINARWFELTGGLRVKIWKALWMGYTARFKFGLKHDETENIIPSDVPGYGRTNKDSYWGFNYQVFIRIPVRKLPAPAEKKR